MEPVNPIGRAIRAAGNAKKLAALLGITPAAVSKWGDDVPIRRVIDVERVTGVSRHDLRPDVFGPAPKAAKRRTAA